METKVTCPLGSECEQIKNDQLHRCRWYVKLVGKDPQFEKMIDRWDCALAWMPILLVENAMTNRGQTAAMESFRNETVKGVQGLASVLVAVSNQKFLDK